MKEAIEAGEGGAVRCDVRASSRFREAEQLVSPVDFMELTPAHSTVVPGNEYRSQF